MGETHNYISLKEHVLNPRITREINVECTYTMRLIAEFNELGVLLIEEPSFEGKFELSLRNATTNPIVFPAEFQLITITVKDDKIIQCIVYDPQTDLGFVHPSYRPYECL
jgi:hypothetical protein